MPRLSAEAETVLLNFDWDKWFLSYRLQSIPKAVEYFYSVPGFWTSGIKPEVFQKIQILDVICNLAERELKRHSTDVHA